MSSTQQKDKTISRRAAVLRVSALFGGALCVSHGSLIAAMTRSGSQPLTSALTAEDVILLDEIAEAILPETTTPCAKAAGVGPFIARMVNDAYSPSEQQIFRAGLASLKKESIEMNGRSFLESRPEQRRRLLEKLDREQYDAMRSRVESEPVHYFRMVKELTLLGYFTSEIGYTKAMRYRETPGRYDPCVPYKKGEKAWAPHA